MPQPILIKIKLDTKLKLISLKKHYRDTFDDVIKDLLLKSSEKKEEEDGRRLYPKREYKREMVG
jgi:hypothetical protein